jgi:UDP-4-amino-4,6-dideoxy-N-acetyl-beta-L-altrosamine transaminase
MRAAHALSPTANAQFLPYGRQSIGDDDVEAVVEALRADLLTTGPRVEAFECRFTEMTGAGHAIAVSNGTAALHLALLTLDLEPGDVCIVPTITFLATANAVRLAGGEVVFADVDPDTGRLDPDRAREAAARAVGARVRAILPVHYGGPMVDLQGLRAVAEACGAVLIEDACHALGSRDQYGHAAGACVDSDMACFSFHPVKTIACGEGGMITTADPRVAAGLRRLRSHGMERALDAFEDRSLAVDVDGGPAPWAYEMAAFGLNYRLTDIQCALGLSQLSKLPTFLARRASLVAAYRARLASFAPTLVSTPLPAGQSPGWHLMSTLIDFAATGMSRRVVMERLKKRGIGSQVHYIPVHRQPYYRQRYGALDLPGAERFYARTLSLPLFADMQLEDVDRVVAALAEAIA